MRFAAFSLACALAAGIAGFGVNPSAAQSENDPVIARVDGTEIRQSDLALAEADIGASLPPASPEERRKRLLDFLIDVTIIANAAEARNVDDAPGFDRRLAFARRKVLMEALLSQESEEAATDAAARELYDASAKNTKPEEEVRARHILVETEEKAKELLAKLKSGGDFAEIAEAESKDTGVKNGGDLGYFTREQMVPEFADAAFGLETGELSGPVKTQFGWHIIKVEDKRRKPIPDFDSVKGDIRTYLARRAQAALVGKLREAADVERLPQKSDSPAGTPPAGSSK